RVARVRRPCAVHGDGVRPQLLVHRAGLVTPARIPPEGLAGLDPRWSRLVTTNAHDGERRTWHVLDSGERAPVGTLLPVHGNPTWSYLWRGLLAAPPEGWRVVAVDHLGMGWSERVPSRPRLADRVPDRGAVTAALDIDGLIMTVRHDWGGSISLGWAQEHRDRV